MTRTLVIASALLLGTGVAAAGVEPAAAVTVQMDQARAALELLEIRQRGGEVPEGAWRRLEATEGFRRMLERERGMDERFGLDRGIDGASFRAWAESDAALAELEGQREALAEWSRVDIGRAARMARAYLPPGTPLAATVYPLIREQRNSFVWDLESDSPAIFMFVEPGRDAAELEHILAHELHHVGVARCPGRPASGDAGLDRARRWLTAFGEGMATLAAAGGPDGDPHPFADDEARRLWQVRIDSIETDMADLEAFFVELLDGTLEGDEAGRRGMGFINAEGAPQGAFYSVGWHMASTVERRLGREALVETVCRPERLLAAYNDALEEADQPRWTEELLRRLHAR